MYKTILQGRFSHKFRSLTISILITLTVMTRRLLGKPMVREWSSLFEIANLFWRAQFNHALSLTSPQTSRAYFDSLYTVLDHQLDIDVRATQPDEPRGDWFIPRQTKSEVTMLYLHGGGYAFYAAVTRKMIEMLAQHLGIAIFAPDYRLTPEHPHPAQLDDGLAAYQYLLARGIKPNRLVIAGDSAGGHLMLMLLVRLRELKLIQPVIGIGISPWTDVGQRPPNDSQFGNDRFDMVQGYMTLKFAQWLKGDSTFTDAELSPIHQKVNGLAPIYLQAGGKEILVDMIRDFAQCATEQQARVRLDVWEHMTHEFHAYGNHLAESQQALSCMRDAITWATNANAQSVFATCAQTEINNLQAHNSIHTECT